MVSAPRPLTRILARSPELDRLRRAALQREQLLARVRAALPSPVDQHCVGASLSERGLVLVADSPAWATRLRFLAPGLARALGGPAVSVRVLPIDTPPPRRPERRLELSSRNARLLEQTAQSIDDPELRQALKRLALRGRNAAR